MLRHEALAKARELKKRQEQLHRKFAQFKPRQSDRYSKWEKLLADTPYIPNKTDRVAIVGAGPAGLHMAYLLDEMGFTNVTLLEQSERFAGKSLTRYNYECGTPQEFGTCYTIPFKYGELRRCANEMGYTAFEEVPVPERHVFRNYEDRNPMTQDQWLVSSKVQKPPFQDLPDFIKYPLAMLATGVDMIRYNFCFHNLFRKDIKEIFEETSMTFEEYLKKHDFEDLIPLFSLANTIQGYGYVSQLPALYGLWWNSPDEVRGFLASAIGIVDEPASILRRGFTDFWDFMAEYKNFDIQYEVDITSVERGDDVKIHSQNGCQTFDFLIITSNLKDCLQFLDADDTERTILGALTQRSNLSTSLITVKHVEDPVALSSWINSLSPDNEKRLMTVRNSYKIFFPETMGKKLDYLVSYQYQSVADVGSEEQGEELAEILQQDLKTAGYEDIKIHEQHIWQYFTHWDQDGMDKLYPVKLMQRQGTHRTWFAGASTLFESVHDCMEYNLALTGPVRQKLGLKRPK